MRPKTVDVPEEMEALFAEAERVVGYYFQRRVEAPEHGTIEIAGERYVLLRAASLSVEFFRVVRALYGDQRDAEADAFARNILFDLAHAVGRSDAQVFAERVGATDPIGRLSAGPVHFAYSGWAKVEISPRSRAVPDDDYYLLYDHPYSFESDAWIRTRRGARFPVCIMNAGYSAGWCSASFGLELVATEIMCRARGDEACRFIMAPPHRIEGHIEEYLAQREPGRAVEPLDRDYEIPDLFARKRLEERLRKAHAELEDRVRERTAELERANALLREEMETRERVERQLRQSQKMEAIGRLAGGIAHDFNNVLGVILGYTSVLERRSRGDAALEEALSEIAHAGRQAAELTQRLLALGSSRIQKSEALDLNAIVDDMGALLGRLVGDPIRFVSALGEDVPAIWTHSASIQQVLLNLVVNARDAMPEGGVLSISTRREIVEPGASSGLAAGLYAVLVVEDSGIGMDEATRDRIFDPFFTTKPPGQGTGLGLSTVYGIVSGTGGAITVQSARGHGARFQVFLPAFAGAARHVEVTPPAVHGRGHGRILVVEDDLRLRQVICQMLELAGYVVVEARDAAQALEIASREEPFSLVITDVTMPGESGTALAERLHVLSPGMPIVLVSGYGAAEDLRRALDQDRVEYLPKPFGADELLRVIERLLPPGGEPGA